METEDLDFDPLEYEYSNFAPDWEIEAEEHRYSYHNSEAEMQEHPERFWFDDETGDWERIDL
jgi:hypothetical protein